MTALGRARLAGRVLIGAIALAIAVDGVAVGRGCERLRPPRAGQEAPGFELPRIDEQGRIGPEVVSLESLRGRAVVIDFWATWCAPCRQSMPVLSRAVAARGDRVVLLSVATDGHEQPLRARQLVDQRAPQGILVADGGAIADRYGVSTIPHVVVVAPDGRIVAVDRAYSGPRDLAEMLETSLNSALAE